MELLNIILQWLESHVWLCSFIVAACAVLTFIFTFLLKKKKGDATVKMKIKRINCSNINQANGNITIKK